MSPDSIVSHAAAAPSGGHGTMTAPHHAQSAAPPYGTEIEAALRHLRLRHESLDDPRRSRLRWAIAEILAMPCGAIRLENALACCISDMTDPQRVALLRTVAGVEVGAQGYVAAVKKAGARFTPLTQLRFAQKLANLEPALMVNIAEAVFAAFQWAPPPDALGPFVDALLEVPFDERVPLAALARSDTDYAACQAEPAETLRALQARDVLRDPDLRRVLRDYRWRHPARAMAIASAARDHGLLVAWLGHRIMQDLELCADYAQVLPFFVAQPISELERTLRHVGALQRTPFEHTLASAVRLRERLGDADTELLITHLEAMSSRVARLLLNEDITPAEVRAIAPIARQIGRYRLDNAADVRAILRLLRRDPASVQERIALAKDLHILEHPGTQPAWLMLCMLPREHLAAVAALAKARGLHTLDGQNLQRVALAEIIRAVRSPATRARDAWQRAKRGVRYVLKQGSQLWMRYVALGRGAGPPKGFNSRVSTSNDRRRGKKLFPQSGLS